MIASPVLSTQGLLRGSIPQGWWGPVGGGASGRGAPSPTPGSRAPRMASPPAHARPHGSPRAGRCRRPGRPCAGLPPADLSPGAGRTRGGVLLAAPLRAGGGATLPARARPAQRTFEPNRVGTRSRLSVSRGGEVGSRPPRAPSGLGKGKEFSRTFWGAAQ